MQPLNQIMKGITSKNNENRPFRLLEHFDVIEGTCECGEPFEVEYKMYVPKKEEPVHYTSEKCFMCEQFDIVENIQREHGKKMAEQRKKNIERMFSENSLMNPKLRQASFESYQPTNEDLARAKAITQRYAENFTKDNPVSLLLIGNYGTGKSHLSVAITKDLMDKDYTCIFISTPKLMSKIRSTYNKDSEYTEEQIINQLSKVDCLVLDDIGAESTKQGDGNQHTWATSKIFEVIDNRIGKHTIFTSNYEPQELQERLGGRNFSRMMESVHVVKMYGDDYRLRDFK